MSELKEEHRRKIVEKLHEGMGRPATSPKETRVIAATAEILSGTATISQAEKIYAVRYMEVKRFLEKTFSTEEDKYKFLEDCMITNAMLASNVFQEKYDQMSALDAARAASLFSDKAVTIRKSRESGFRETPINVGVILSLERTLNKLTNETI